MVSGLSRGVGRRGGEEGGGAAISAVLGNGRGIRGQKCVGRL